MTIPWKEYVGDWLLFSEAGFIAVNLADEDASLKLFKAAETLNPQSTLPQIGFGYLHLHKLELKQAVKKFEDVLAMEPDNEIAKALLGLCLGLMPSSIEKGEKVLEETLHSSDPLIKQLSGTAVNFINKFIKKTPGPAGK